MSRRPVSLPFAQKVNKFLRRFPELSYDGIAIQCLICETSLVGWNSSNCIKHIKSARHIKNKKLQVPYSIFIYDLIFILNVCNIPAHVLNNEHFRLFWKKYAPKWQLPTKGRIRRYVPRVKEQIEDYIRLDLSEKKLWVTVDETTVKKGNKVGHVLVRNLLPNQTTMPFLIASKKLEGNNAEAVQQLLLQAFEKFNINLNNVLMLVTDGTAHMIEAAATLKNMCPNLLHITCLLRILHRVSETVRSNYPDVDKLILNTRMIFYKSPQRIKEFYKECPGIPEPPQTVLTQWGSWLKAALYYSEYFHVIKSMVFKFNSKDSKAIKESQMHFENSQIEENLKNIQQHYSVLAHTIDQLQDNSITLLKSFDILDNVNMSLLRITDGPGVQAAMELNNSLNTNPDLAQLRYIKQCLSDGYYTSELYKYFTNANVTSMDVERSFSTYKAIFTDKRTSFKETTIEGILMMQAYARTQLAFIK